jgi:hypothetical protein
MLQKKSYPEHDTSCSDQKDSPYSTGEASAHPKMTCDPSTIFVLTTSSEEARCGDAARSGARSVMSQEAQASRAQILP